MQEAYDTWRQAGERMEQLGHEAQRHRLWKSCQRAFRVSLTPCLGSVQARNDTLWQ